MTEFLKLCPECERPLPPCSGCTFLLEELNKCNADFIAAVTESALREQAELAVLLIKEIVSREAPDRGPIGLEGLFLAGLVKVEEILTEGLEN